MNIFVCGPDGVGKTTVGKQMAKELTIPYFKVKIEHALWHSQTFHQSLKFDALLPQFCKQTNTSFVSDRGYQCEFAYSKAFGRQTDLDCLRQIDEEWAELGATSVLCFLHDYSLARPDDLVKQDELKRIEDAYLEFADWTKTDVIGVYFDEFLKDQEINHSLVDYDKVCKEIYAGLEAFRIKRKYPRVYEIIKKENL